MKRILAVLLTLSLLAGMLVTGVSAAEETQTGVCGDNLTWTMTRYTLTISGTGPMYDYSLENPAPWLLSSSWINKIVIEQGVTSIGNYAFYFQEKHNADPVVHIASSVTYIGDFAFNFTVGGQTRFDYFFIGDAPEVGTMPLSDMDTIYVVNWSEEDKARFQIGEFNFKESKISLDALESNRFVGLNEALKPEDLRFWMLGDTNTSTDDAKYLPRQVTFSDYDNSTYGEKKVTVTADGFTFDYTYYVTDGTNHLDLIQVAFPELPVYEGGKIWLSPVVTMGTEELVEGEHYELDITGATIGTDARVHITGKGIAKGFEKTFYYPILKKDVADYHIASLGRTFFGIPVETEEYLSGNPRPVADRDFQVIYENNINVGTATIRAVGSGDYFYGDLTQNFEIEAGGWFTVDGECIGTLEGELSEDIPIYEQMISPGQVNINVRYTGEHIAAYALYKVDEELTLITEYVSDAGAHSVTAFKYDFSSVYEGAVETGGEVYLLSYSWVTALGEVYAGATILYVPAKVPQATSMTLHRVENDGDFRKDYLNLTGDDGALNDIIWTSSDNAVATVENGVVTFKKPGDVIVTGRSGQLQEAYRFTVEGLDITEGFIFDYSQENGNARVIYDNRLLEEGTDYTLSVKNKTLTVTGRGLFTGELEKTFINVDDLADPHTHGFDNGCDQTCNSCGYTRNTGHKYTEQWSKNQTHHWHACTGCGEKAEYAAHVFNPANPSVCTVCGPMYTAGDLNGDSAVNEDDAIYLLQHVLLPDFFPIAQDADYNGDSRINEDDAIYLLQHVLLPEFFPL